MAGEHERDVVEEATRNQMMQNLFGDQSEDEEEDDDVVEVAGGRQSTNDARQSDYQSEEGEAENDGEGEGESEGQGEVEEESEGEPHDAEHDEQEETDAEKAQSSPDRELHDGDRRIRADAKDADSEDEGYGQRMVSSRRREAVASESEGSEENYYADRDHEDESKQTTVKKRYRLAERYFHRTVDHVSCLL